MHSVPGVDYVDIDILVGLSESDAKDEATLKAFLSNSTVSTAIHARGDRVDQKGKFHPAQIVYLDPNLPDALILNRIH
jgi:hypothetical protein